MDVGEGDIEMQEIREESDGNGIRATVAFPTIKRVMGESRALNSGRYEPRHVWIGPYHYPQDSMSQVWSRMDDGQKCLHMFTTVAANKPPEVRVGVCAPSFPVRHSLPLLLDWT